MINVIITFSRPYAIDRLVNDLTKLIKPRDTTLNLLVMADISAQDFIEVRNKFVVLKDFNEVLVMHYNPPNAFNRPIKEHETIIRRERISAIHNEARMHLWDSDLTLIIEDDGFIDSHSLMNLLAIAQTNPDFGGITGYQQSRHNRQFLGAYQVDDLTNPNQITSVKPYETNTVDACGLYFMLVKSKLYEQHQFKPFGGIYSYAGPDIDFSYNIRKQGYPIYIDWNTPIPHYDGNKVLPMDNLWRAIISKTSSSWVWSYTE